MLGVLLIVFIIMRMAPGDPVLAQLGNHYTQEQYEAKEHALGLDKPVVLQFVDYVKNIVTKFDLGTSYKTNRSVNTEIFSRLPVTLKLALCSCLVTVVLGIPFGIICAVKQYSPADYCVTTFSLFFASIPSFWLGLMLIIIFALKLQWLPASMPSTTTSDIRYWILPVVTLGMSTVALLTRFTRSTMLDVVRQDYITTARSKGLKEGRIIFKHALPNALIPIITSLGLQLGMMVAGSVVVENIFSIPGIGNLVTTAVRNQDYPLIQGCVLVLSVLVCLINLLVDIIYGFVDPRIMSMYQTGKKKRGRLRKAEAAAAGKEAE